MLRFRIRLEYPPHECIGCDVKHRTDGPKKHHESTDVCRIPFEWFFDEFFIDVVEGNRNLGNIVKQVLHQKLQWKHRQKWQKRAGNQNRKDISKIRACRHSDVLEHVVKGLPTFDHTFFKNHQTLFKKDDVCRFFGDVHG